MKVKFDGGIKDVPMTEVTAENYIVPKGEESLYHVIQEVVEFDAKTGKRKSHPELQKYNDKVWTQQRKALQAWGYTLQIVHDPSKYNAQQAEERERIAAERRIAAAERERERRAAEREQLKAELRAELLAEMNEQKKTKKANK